MQNSFNNESAMHNNLIRMYKTSISKVESDKNAAGKALRENPNDLNLRKLFMCLLHECVNYYFWFFRIANFGA